MIDSDKASLNNCGEFWWVPNEKCVSQSNAIWIDTKNNNLQSIQWIIVSNEKEFQILSKKKLLDANSYGSKILNAVYFVGFCLVAEQCEFPILIATKIRRENATTSSYYIGSCWLCQTNVIGINVHWSIPFEERYVKKNEN